jgi:hypothetical protein
VKTHTAFVVTSRPILRAIKRHQASCLPGQRVGDESAGFSYADGTIQNYQIVFRRQTVIIALTYKGPSGFSAGQFVQLAATVAHRLR